ncbi:arylesterase [Croceivirga thetidis]|uniref:Arylesterase n=1 Tax=Croceivirga thetidis TaxID=2721623 RepID=A0ABX1GR12_9FLAO|nr:arylesterase [Croceivirga thetidis]NKI32356.1 arylesterase [Croceivirga thetidis]
MSGNFLKLCYFLGFLMLFSCKESTKEDTGVSDESKNEVQEAETKSGTKKILFFGDSLTAGYGLEDSDEAFPGIIQEKIDSLGWNYEVVNSGVSGETTAGGIGRINWILKQDIDVFILELGANDGLRGVQLSETRENLQGIVDAVRDKNPNIPIVLAGMQLPPNMGQEYTTGFRKLFAEIAEKNELHFIPFLLRDVGGVAELNQADGIHPTAEGHHIVANTVWEFLEPVIKP